MIKKKTLAIIVLGFILFEIIVTIYTVSLPKEYLSTSTLLAPESESPGVVLNTPYGELQNPELSKAAISSQAILALLQSRRLANRVIKKFNLLKLYRANNNAQVLKKYFKNLMVDYDPDRGTIVVGFISTKPFLSKDIVEYMLTQLDSLNTELKLTSRKPVVKIIDYPNVPQHKYRPHLSYNLILGLFLYLAIVISVLSVKELLKGVKIE